MKKLDAQTKKTLWLSSLGGTLEFYDFIIFLFFTSAISRHFFPEDLSPFWKNLNTYGIFAAAYFARPLGGIIMAHFGDTTGRKKMFLLSIVLMVLPTFTLGVMPTFESIGYVAVVILLLVRILQGVAIGGELPGAWVFVSEHTPKYARGKAIGILTASVAGGILLGSIVTVAVRLIFGPAVEEWAWRIPFILGGVFGLISVYLRLYLEETPVFQAIKASNATHNFPLKSVIGSNKIAILVSMGFTWILTGCVVVMTLVMPKFVGLKLGFTELQIVLLQMLVVFGMCSGCVIVGLCSDRFGITKTCLGFCLGLLLSSVGVIYLVFIGMSKDALLVCGLYFICGLFVGCACFAPLYSLRLFPSRIRFSGLSFSYNIAYAVFGGSAPIFVSGAVASGNAMGVAYYVAFLACLGIALALFVKKYALFERVQDQHD